MMEMIKEALSERNGNVSSSRIGMWALVGTAVGGFFFASIIIGHSYFVNGIIPGADSILVYYLGGSATGGISGSMLYFANQYGNTKIEDAIPTEDLPEAPAGDSAFKEDV